jgi:hypothetical protein
MHSVFSAQMHETLKMSSSWPRGHAAKPKIHWILNYYGSQVEKLVICYVSNTTTEQQLLVSDMARLMPSDPNQIFIQNNEVHWVSYLNQHSLVAVSP